MQENKKASGRRPQCQRPKTSGIEYHGAVLGWI